ncbi:hypothetical protein JOC62_003230 [Clostridium sardiniense]|nr:hypothetical protein [Clostridium sardiniense]
MELFVFIIAASIGCSLALYYFNKNDSKAN